MKQALILLLLATLAWPAQADPLEPGERVRKALLWGLVPGGGHFYLGEKAEGAAYAGSMLTLTAGGIWLNERNRKWDREDEANTFWLLALKEWELSLFTTYRNAIRAEGLKPRDLGVDETPVRELSLSPFRKANASDPKVMLAAALGVAAAALTADDTARDYGHVGRVGILGATPNQAWGYGLYGLDAFALSLAAGVSEEALWRGVIQNELEMIHGPRVGLWSTATLFGALHVVDIDGGLSAERVLVATLAGLYLGHLYQQDDHRLARPIAAHFWYNFAAMLTSFALDPEDNPLGVEVSFQF